MKGKREMTFINKIFGQYRGLSRNAYVLFFGRLVTSMGAFIFPMLMLILKEILGYTFQEATTLIVKVGFIFLASNLIGGFLADRFNRKRVIITLDIISVALFYVCAFVQPNQIFLYFLIASAFFASMEGPSYDALIAESTLPAEREKAFSLAYLGFNLGFTFGATMAGLLFPAYLSLAFILDGTTTIMSTFLIIFLVKPYKQEEIKDVDKNEYEEHEVEKKSIFKVLFQRKSLILFLLTGVLGSFIYDQWSIIVPAYMSDIWGADRGSTYYGFVAGFNGLIVIIFTPVMVYVLRKRYELEKMIFGALMIGLSFLALVNAAFLYVFFLFMLVFTLGEVINSIGSSPYMTRRVPGSHRGRLSSFMFFGYFAGAQIGKYLTGVIVGRYGYNYALYMMAIVGIIEVMLILANRKLDKNIFPNLYITPPGLMKTSIMLEREEQSLNLDV